MWKQLSIALFCAVAFASCDDDNDEDYPSIVTQFVDIESNAEGRFFRITNDQEQTYLITNSMEGYEPNTVYRSICGYVPQGNQATIYQLTAVQMLRESTSVARHDPIAVNSVWHAGRYVNMQLAPRTQGDTQYWGFQIDSLRPGHLFLSLHHNQNGDPTSYTQNVYACILLNHIAGYSEGDSITLAIATFGGTKKYEMK